MGIIQFLIDGRGGVLRQVSDGSVTALIAVTCSLSFRASTEDFGTEGIAASVSVIVGVPGRTGRLTMKSQLASCLVASKLVVLDEVPCSYLSNSGWDGRELVS